MANKNVNILLKLQDQFTKPMIKAGKITEEQQKAMMKCSSSVMGFSRNVRTGFTNAAKNVLKFGTALAGIGGALSVAGLSRLSAECEELAKAQVEAETKLEAVLGNVKSIADGGTDSILKAKEAIMGTASEVQRLGVIGDEVTLAGTQQLATFQLTEDSLKKLMPGMADLIAQQKGLNATQSDAVSIGNLIGKAMTGQTGALSKAGIIMDEYQAQVMKTGTETERAAMLAKILEQNVGGVNAALANTDQGAIQQVANAWGDAKEEIGKHVLSMKAMIARNLVDYIPKIQEVGISVMEQLSAKVEQAINWIKAHQEQIKGAFESVKSGVTTAWGIIKPILGFALQHANVLIPAILGVTGAISGISIVADVATKVNGLITTVRTLKNTFDTASAGMKAAGGVLKWLRAGPIGLIILIIAAAIAVGVLLYKNWDKIKAAAQALGTKVKTVFNGIKDKIVGVFDTVKEKVKAVFDWFKEKFDWLKDQISFFTKGNSLVGDGGYVSRVDHNATGTPYFRGGLTHINEGGRGEIVSLPSGTKIIPHDVAKQQSNGPSIVVNLTVQGNVIGNRAFMEQTGQYITNKILAAQGVV